MEQLATLTEGDGIKTFMKLMYTKHIMYKREKRDLQSLNRFCPWMWQPDGKNKQIHQLKGVDFVVTVWRFNL